MTWNIKEVDRVEILTLQDNYFDALSGDSNAIVSRALPIKDMEVKNTILAEHGFSALVTVYAGGRSRSLLFDFGFSEFGAAFNADTLDVDLTPVEALVLSHGHLDHAGGLNKLVEMTGRADLPLYVHPAAFRNPRYIKLSEDLKFNFPAFTREKADDAGVKLTVTEDPVLLLDDTVLFLGDIPRRTDFEKGAPNFFYRENDEEQWDPIDDDTGIAMRVKGQGLVVLSGCAHAGIINTVEHAKDLTGENNVYAVMGGFHLTGPAMAPLIEPTLAGLKEIAPRYIVPTHCTGRAAVQAIELAFPDGFLLNMAGTKMTFAA